jgi:glycosyltransferase involved in cell wall biosynthesis
MINKYKTTQPNFRNHIRQSFEDIMQRKRADRYQKNYLKIDLHCHDFNSDVPDELWGRILRLPETWLRSEDLLKCLTSNGVDAFTITNHNNARSCWTMLDKGIDVLSAAEFTCRFPEYDVYIHVLAYGFTPEQEVVLNKKRRNVYDFAAYTNEHHIPTVLPHPLYFYKRDGQPPMELFEKMAVLFERFEALNGQRDAWQNLLTLEWTESLNEEIITGYGKKHGLNPAEFCRNPFKKRITGGSDDHMGIFAGSNGTMIYVDNLEEKLLTNKTSELVLEGLRHGDMLPYGQLAEEEKLNVAFLDYFCQVGLNMEEPGLLRMMLHQGSAKDKLICLAISNGMQEMRRHRYTYKFLSAFHEAFSGKKPNVLAKLTVAREYKPLLKKIEFIADVRKKDPERLLVEVKNLVPDMFTMLNELLVNRVENKIMPNIERRNLSWAEVIETMELPSHFRTLFQSGDHSGLNLGDILDKLSFPTLISTLLAFSSLMSTRVLYSGRSILNQFTKQLGKYEHPKRTLWLTDTFYDKNGVSSVLQLMLKEVQSRDLPIDFLICDANAEAEDHLHVVKPLSTFAFKEFGNQEFRVPNLLEIHKIFLEGSYDRIMCSTEFLMGGVALFLKESFQVPAHFFMHTDWLEYFEKSVYLEKRELDRVRRMIRAFYKQFDKIFVLNSDHKAWLTGRDMLIPESSVSLTAHWAADIFKPTASKISQVFNTLDEDDIVLLYSGRISSEKGVFDLPKIYEKVKHTYPQAKLVIAGTGSDEEALRALLPEALFLGWVDSSKLPEIYSAADLLILPSTFDTFGCVVLEAMQCGCPVAAYNQKGPKDIISHNENGLLADHAEALARSICELLADPEQLARLRKNALSRTTDYSPTRIVDRMLVDMGLENVRV